MISIMMRTFVNYVSCLVFDHQMWYKIKMKKKKKQTQKTWRVCLRYYIPLFYENNFIVVNKEFEIYLTNVYIQ